MKKYAPLLVMTLLFATGCESAMYRFLYNSMDSFLYRAITWYVEPSPDQDRFIREKLGTLHQWHRRSELLKYVNTLQGLRERMGRGLTKEDVSWAVARIEVHETDLFNAVSNDVVSFLITLDEKQVDHMDSRIGERLDELEAKMNRDKEERLLEAEKNTKRIMGFVYGDLTARQEEEIAKGVRGMENIDALSMRMYRERRADFISFLRKKPGREAAKAYLKRLALDTEKTYPDYYRGPAERRDRAVVDAIVRFDRELVTPAQRAHALGKIDSLIQVLRELAAG